MRILGKDIALYVKGELVGLAKSCSIDISLDVTEVASADARAKAFKAGRYTYTMSVDRLYDGQGDGTMASKLLAYQINGSVVSFIIKHTTEGDYMSGNVLITNSRVNADAQGYAGHSVNFQGTGALTF